MSVEKDGEVGGSVALIFVVVALDLPGLGRDRLAHLADQLGRALVETDHRMPRIGLFCVEIEHILHASNSTCCPPGECTTCPCAKA